VSQQNTKSLKIDALLSGMLLLGAAAQRARPRCRTLSYDPRPVLAGQPTRLGKVNTESRRKKNGSGAVIPNPLIRSVFLARLAGFEPTFLPFRKYLILKGFGAIRSN
jgi:hypothetical protein